MQATEFEQNFQFLYVCDGSRVVGVSPAFVFTRDAQLTQNLLLEQAIDDFASLVYVDVGDQTGTILLYISIYNTCTLLLTKKKY